MSLCCLVILTLIFGLTSHFVLAFFAKNLLFSSPPESGNVHVIHVSAVLSLTCLRFDEFEPQIFWNICNHRKKKNLYEFSLTYKYSE